MYVDFLKFMELVDEYSFWALGLEINNQSYNNIHTSLERPFNYLSNVI